MEENNKVQRLGESRNSIYWIVYQTINLVNNKIYVGVHKTNDPFTFDGYLGNGVYINSPKSYMYATTMFEAAVKKYGPKSFRRTVLQIFNTEKEAYELEAQIVNENFLKRSDVYNMILGGKSPTIEKPTTSLYQYSLGGTFTKEFSSSQSTGYKQASMAAQLGNIVDNKFRFCYVKASTYSTARDLYIKQRIIYQYDSNGQFLKEWKYLEALKQFPHDNINQAIRHKKLTKSNYYWGLCKYDVYNAPIVKQQRKIAKYDLAGNLIEIYKNSSECYKINGKNTYKVLVGLRKSYKDFIYKYIE